MFGKAGASSPDCSGVGPAGGPARQFALRRPAQHSLVCGIPLDRIGTSGEAGQGGSGPGEAVAIGPVIGAAVGVPEAVAVPALRNVETFAVMEDLTAAEGGIAVGANVLGQGDDIGELGRPGLFVVSVDAGGGGTAADEQRGAGGVADGRGGMRAGKEQAGGGEAVK